MKRNCLEFIGWNYHVIRCLIMRKCLLVYKSFYIVVVDLFQANSSLESKMRPLFVGNIEYDTRQSELERLFSKYGRIERVDMKSGSPFCLLFFFLKKNSSVDLVSSTVPLLFL